MKFLIAFMLVFFLVFLTIKLFLAVVKTENQTRPTDKAKDRKSADESAASLKALFHPEKPRQSRYRTKKSQSGNTGALEFNYVDAFDQPSQRKAKIISLERYGTNTYLNAYCFLRNEPRQFRTDRISNPVDLETGEIIDDLEVWALNQGLEMENEFDGLSQQQK